MRRGNKHILTLPTLLFLAVSLLCVNTLDARTRTTRKNLQSLEVPVAVMDAADGLLPDSLDTDIDPNAVTLKGYSKRASDSKESFFITNNTKHRMSAVRLLLRYTTMSGEMLTQRTVTVPVSLKPGETKLVSVKTFDVQRLFYYYAVPSRASRPRPSRWRSV